MLKGMFLTRARKEIAEKVAENRVEITQAVAVIASLVAVYYIGKNRQMMTNTMNLYFSEVPKDFVLKQD